MIKTTYFYFIILFLAQLSIGQNPADSSSVSKLPPYQDSIYSFSSRLKLLDSRKEIHIKGDALTKIRTSKAVNLINAPNTKGQLINRLKTGTSIRVYDYVHGYWLVTTVKKNGYIIASDLESNQVMEDVIYNYEYSRLSEEYGEKNTKKILNGEIWYGMSQDMTKESIGEPLTRSTTTGIYGIREQWNYEGKYLIFENNFLTFWGYL